MEFNPQNPKKLSDQIRWSSDDSGARSYNCAFCKRGFSNAQALGGHMNIHRRDKAKLRENLLSLESNKNPSTSTSDHDQPHHKPSNLEEKVLFQLDSGEEINYTSNHKQVININDSSAEVLPKIPFFAGNNERITEEKSEIDLELRLGLEPHEAPTLSTREFF